MGASLGPFFSLAEQKQFLEAPIQANRYRGQIFGVPLFVDAGLLYYRKDLLEKYGMAPPRTWPELVEQAIKILRQEKDSQLVGFSGQFKQYEGLVCNMMEYILSNGGNLWDEKKLVSALNQPRALEAVRFVRDRIIGQIAHRGVLAYEEPESLVLFTEGRAIFHRNWPYAWNVANDSQRSKIAGKIGMMPLPAFPGGKGVAALGGWQLAISRFSRQSELAWRFVAFMTSHAMQKRITLSTGRAPARAALYDDPAGVGPTAAVEIVVGDFQTSGTPADHARLCPAVEHHAALLQLGLGAAGDQYRQPRGLGRRDMDRVLDLLREAPAP